MPIATPGAAERRRQLVAQGSLLPFLDDADGRALLAAEADDPNLTDAERFITRESLDHLLLLRDQAARPRPQLGLFGSDDVIIVPGFMGSALKDVTGPFGLIWISLGLIRGGGSVDAMRLQKFRAGLPDQDATPGVRIESPGAVPAIYDVLWADLNLPFRGYNPEIFPFDWRTDLERSAQRLAEKIRNRQGHTSKPLHLIAHSQGALVARRALQVLGPDQAKRLVNTLILLGPANYGTFSSALALAGSHPSFEDAQKKLGVKLPPDFAQVFQTFTGLYQLLPCKLIGPRGGSGFDPDKVNLGSTDFWKSGCDPDRLKYGYKWPLSIDTSFFNDRTATILGGIDGTVGAAAFDGGTLKSTLSTSVSGDGTVPDDLARLPGVQRTYRAAGVDHMTMPMHPSVLSAVRAILRGDSPELESPGPGLGLAARVRDDVPVLKKVKPPARPVEEAPTPTPPAPATETTIPALEKPTPTAPPSRREPPTPPCRRLQVFSFDPVLGSHLETHAIARITITVPWEPDGKLTEGPVGEYVEVVDYDPASRCFYQPVDLTHPKLAAQDGLPPNESDPQFHQQMCYAVAMATIATFEKALGRVALWAPHLVRDADDEVIPTPTEQQYVPRLRIYPHALRDQNAFYDPSRHALLFGYFPSREQPGGETLPGGTVFACQSFDIIAHETTHALLHGLHDEFLKPSNPDVLAFHEAFADAVALFQHFSHTEVVRHEIARSRGDLTQGNLLGNLAWQFGQAAGKQRGALRQYIKQSPDPTLYQKSDESHDRGAVLMAALFRAFQNIYRERSRDLYQIAARDLTDGPARDLHPDLVTRLAIEAAKSARHLLTMCIRALDYVPPMDLTFGEYLRALITADHDLVRDDDRGYRVAVIDAFRSWGIYPSDVSVLDEPALLWAPPYDWERDALRQVVQELDLDGWQLRSDRRATFLRLNKLAFKVREWVTENATQLGDQGKSMGVVLSGDELQSVARNKRRQPKFWINSIRPCLRVGPDGEQRRDVVVEIAQRRAGFFDDEVQKTVDSATKPWAFTAQERAETDEKKKRPLLPTANNRPDFWFRSGCTLLIDPDTGGIRYAIGKSIRDDERLARQRNYERGGGPASAALYFGSNSMNPFAFLHSGD